jgi:predicted ATPase
VKIAVSGCEGSGKTTLVNALARGFPGGTHKVLPEGVDEVINRYREFLKMPEKSSVIDVINRLRLIPQSYLDFQRVLSQYRAELENSMTDVICDRAHLDGAAFASLHLYNAGAGGVQFLQNYIQEMGRRTAEMYDLIFYLPPPEWTTLSEGRRLTEKDYLYQFDLTLRGLYHRFHIEVVELKSKTVGDRVTEALDRINCGPFRRTRYDQRPGT